MSLLLKRVLGQHDIALSEVADAAGISRTAASLLCNHGTWPARSRDQVRASIETFIKARGIEPIAALVLWAPPRCTAAAPAPEAIHQTTQENDMLLRKVPLSQTARRHFELQADPFRDCAAAEDVFMSADIRYVRDAMLDKVHHGGFLGVVGESGAGKSTLREALVDHLQQNARHVVVITPHMLASEASDKFGKTLKALHIAEAIMAAIAPHAKILSSPEARFRQLHQALTESSRSGMRHVLVIEEAHSLPIPTLKHLKRFLELKDGLRPLLSVILIGQPELADKLSEGSPEVREVVQRIELVTLMPLDNALDEYLKHRLQLAGVPLARVFEQSGIDALRELLGPTKKGGMSRTYPLMVHNTVARAMNKAAELCVPRVTADIVRGV